MDFSEAEKEDIWQLKGKEWATLMHQAGGGFKTEGVGGMLRVSFPVGSGDNRVTMEITVNPRKIAYALKSQEDEEYDLAVPFEEDMITKKKQCK